MTAATPIRQAMVLAAGLGTRMRPITETLPKPLVAVAGRTLVDRTLDRLAEAGVNEVVVNVHHLAEQIERHLAARSSPRILLSLERELLETGGGVRNALHHFNGGPLFVANSDVVLLNGPRPAVQVLAAAWNDTTMDALLLVHPTVRAFGYNGDGDFMMDPLGRLQRRPEGEIAPYLFTGLHIVHPRAFAGCPATPFSLNRIFDAAIARGRLFGLLHDGVWFHVGTPADIGVVEDYLATQHAGAWSR